MAERKTRTARRRNAADDTNGNGHAAADNTTTAIVRDITQSNAALAAENMRSVSTRGFRPGPPPTQTPAAESDVSPQLTGASTAFGSFVEKVGMAVALAQKELDKTLVDTAKELSKTEIEVVAIYEQHLNDDGTMKEGQTKMAKMPLVNYITPTVYQWSRVFLEANMNVSEFNAESGFKIQNKSNSFSAGAHANYGLLSGFGASGGFNYANSSNSTEVNADSSVNTAAGSMHMEATLEPRGDLALPKPFIVQKGPSVKATVTRIEPISDSSTPPKVVGKRAIITVTARKQDGDPNDGVELDYTVDQPLITHSATSLETDHDGHIAITLERTGAAYADPTKPMPVEVRIWLGLVSDNVVVNL